jgi:hypothetical protein
MTTVFVPMQQRMMDIVREHADLADLIEEPEMPTCLLALCAHVAGYHAVLRTWESGEISVKREDNISVVDFPSQDLADHEAEAFGRLNAEQARLLGAAGSTTITLRSSRRAWQGRCTVGGRGVRLHGRNAARCNPPPAGYG